MALTYKEEAEDFEFVLNFLAERNLNPTFLLSDDSAQIKNAAKKVWPDIKIIDCFFHVRK